MDKKKILQQLIDYYSAGNKRQFAKMIGMSPSGVSTWMARGTYDVSVILAKCEHVNPAYLLTGEGPMLLPDAPGQRQDVDENEKITNMLKNVQEMTEKNLAMLEKNQQQFDRVLSLFEQMTAGVASAPISYPIVEDNKKVN